MTERRCISTANLAALPDATELLRLMKSLAALDAIFCEDWELRYFSFDPQWSTGEQMGSMRNGSGDHYFALFNPAGCWLKGYAHECPAPASDIFKGVPIAFSACTNEPAFAVAESTFCIWRLNSELQWGHSPNLANAKVDDGSADLLKWLDGDPATYARWAQEYYERKVPIGIVRDVYLHKSIDAAKLPHAPDWNVCDLEAELKGIGYP